MDRCLYAPCPLCHDAQGLVVRLEDGATDDGTWTLEVHLIRVECPCSYDEIMSGPFDEVVEQVREWDRTCYPYAIAGEWRE